MCFIILLRLTLWKIYTSRLYLLTIIFFHLWLGVLGLGGRNAKHICNCQSASRQGLNHLELVFCLPRQRYGPIFLTTGSHYCPSGVSIGFFWNGSFVEAPTVLWICLDQAIPPVEGPDAFGWARENLPMPLTKDGEAGLGVPRVYLSGRSPQLVQVTNPALTHLFQG